MRRFALKQKVMMKAFDFSSRFSTKATLAVLAVATLALAGCASQPKLTPEEIVKQRADERWQYLVKGDLEKAYGMLTEGYRKITPYDTYRSRITNGLWIKGQAVEVTCEPEKCEARIHLESKPPLGSRFGGNIDMYFNETWLLEDGQWRFFVQK